MRLPASNVHTPDNSIPDQADALLTTGITLFAGFILGLLTAAVMLHLHLVVIPVSLPLIR